MTFQFTCNPKDGHVEIKLRSADRELEFERWALDAPSNHIPGVDLAHRLEAVGAAISEGAVLLVEHRAIAGLTTREARCLDLPDAPQVHAHIQTRGIITKSEFAVELTWRRATGAPVVGVERSGAFLRIGGTWNRLPEPLFGIAEAVDKVNASSADDLGQRYLALAELREILPGAIDEGAAEAQGVIGSMTIAVADSFSLDLKGEGAEARLVPILYGAKHADKEPLLTEQQQVSFGCDQFHKFTTARSIYTLANGVHVVLSPPLRDALQVVRRVQSEAVARKRAFFANPQAFLQDTLGEDVDGTLVETLFRETPAYSQRVIGLGLWAPRVLPWIKLQASDWFGPDDPQPEPHRNSRSSGLLIGDRSIELTQEECEALQREVEAAIGAERPFVPFVSNGAPIDVPATRETLDALQKVHASHPGGSRPPKALSDRYDGPQAIIIRANENDVELEGEFAPRPALPLGAPEGMASVLKPHQHDGLTWLQKAWMIGRPGVLLADDMGLGKSIQGLAFFAWLRQAMKTRAVTARPLLIVAPTGLLENWKAEHARHLTKPGLGVLVEAYGRGLTAIKKTEADGRPSIDVNKLRTADWVLTTYETLRTFDRDFGLVEFAALIFDEAQKIKTPGIRLTDAAKGMNADFRVAMTGTPVENRLSDLWCITDAIHPAVLGDLRTFSADYEKEPDFDRARRLKASLDEWHGTRPPLMLRRLKQDRLPEIAQPNEIIVKRAMPQPQRDAYLRAIALAKAAKSESRSGGVLSALHELRKCSLHPQREDELSDDAFIEASARLQVLFDVLDKVAAVKEKALIFLNDLDMQAKLVGIIQRRYKMAVPPLVINGAVPAKQRQERVDQFQAGPEEFDAMILSPQAGGVGLTLTRANHVIHLARWWNPAVEDQCTGRALRIGQSRTVNIYLPIATSGDGTSFDENLHALLGRKRKLMNDALMPPEFTPGDLDSLLQSSL